MNEAQRKHVAECRDRVSKTPDPPWEVDKERRGIRHRIDEYDAPFVASASVYPGEEGLVFMTPEVGDFVDNARVDVLALCDLADEQDAEITRLRESQRTFAIAAVQQVRNMVRDVMVSYTSDEPENSLLAGIDIEIKRI